MLSLPARIRSVLRGIRRGDTLNEDMEAEFRLHMDLRAEELVRAGLTPAEAARAAIENDVHVIGVSSQAAGHKTLVPQLIDELAKQGGGEVLVVVGGVVPAQDYDFLKKAGVAAIYGPGTNIPQAASEVLALVRRRSA